MLFVIPVLFEPVFRPSSSAMVPQGPSHHVGYKLRKFFIFSLNKFQVPASPSHPFEVFSQFRTDLTHPILTFLTTVRKHFQDFQITRFSYSVLMYSFASYVTQRKNLEPSSGALVWKYCSFSDYFLMSM